MGSVIPAVGLMTPEWVDFLVMTGAFLLVGLGGIIWIFYFRKSRRRRRRHRHQHRSGSQDLSPPSEDGLTRGRREGKSTRLPPEP